MMRKHPAAGMLGSLVASCALLASAALARMAAGAAPPAVATSRPASVPTSQPLNTRDEKAARLFDYLTVEYSKQLKTRDWLQRALATIGLSQLPTEAATDVILERLANETHAIARLVAWQATLGRASRLADPQFAAWQRATVKMTSDDLFHGDLRIGLLEMLSATPITPEQRKMMQSLFIKSNALDSTDVPTLVALGRAIRAWGEAGPIDDMLAATAVPNAAVRAKFVLKAAGFEPELGAPPEKFKEWWKANKDSFTQSKPGPQAWRKLKPQFIDAPVDAARVNPDDASWKRQLELTAPGLRDFDFGISVDCSKSMGGELARLKRDLQVMYAAFAQVAMEPRVALTGFAPGGEVRNILPLSGRKAELLAAVQKLEIFGPAGEEEWAGGVEQLMTGSKWAPITDRTRARQVIAIISDEPITQPQHEKLVPLMKRANDEGFRVYAMMIHPLYATPDPLTTPLDRNGSRADAADDAGPAVRPGRAGRPGGPNRPNAGGGNARGWQSYPELTALASGKALACRVPQGGFGLGTLAVAPPPGGGGLRQQAAAIDPATAIAPIYPGGGPTARLLTAVLVDVINPQYADRVAPLVRILVNHSQHAAPHVSERR